ncbi:MAG: AIR synthase-related protein, partial [Ferruginibacter sp.]
DVLSKFYAEKYKESYNVDLDEDVVYIGSHQLLDTLVTFEGQEPLTVGEMLLSPTRTYAPVLIDLLKNHFDKIHGLIHCSGGGQTKCMKYLPGNFRIIKDNLFTPPEIFNIIQTNSGSSNKEMYEVFNMGCRLEIYCDAADAQIMMEAAHKFNIDAQIIGRVEAADKKELVITAGKEIILY